LRPSRGDDDPHTIDGGKNEMGSLVSDRVCDEGGWKEGRRWVIW